MKTKHITAKQYFNRPWGSVVAAILLFTACSSDTPNSSASLTVSVPHRAVSALATGDQPSNALPQDITRVAISITDSNGAQLAGGDAATGGTIALKVPPGQSLNVSGTAYAGDTARFEGKTTVPPLRPGERSNVSLTLNEIGVLQLTEPVQVDVTDTGVVADNSSNGWRFTTDNNYVLFTSSATNLVEGLATGTDNTISHVYLKNLNTNAISLVDTANDGTPGNGYAYGAEISSDGRYIVFDSDSDNLVSGDDNQNRDVFLKDMTTGQTTRLSVSPDSSGGYEPSISDDGRYITFISTNTLIAGSNGVYLFDTTSGELSFVANEFSAEISGDGKSVATWSDVEGGGPLTLYDLASKQPTEIASWTDGGYDISQDGRYVAFSSTDSYSSLDTNSGDDIYLYDKTDQTIKLIDTDNNGDILVSNPVPGRIFNYSPRISADGRYAIFQYGPLIYIKDTTTNKTITVQQQGYYPFISPDGQRIGFTSSYDQHLYVAPNPFLVPPKPQTELQGQSGNVRVYLEWSNGENLDLSIKDPCANTIDYTNKSAVCGAYTGAMDIDFPTTTGTANQVENIAWANGAATGIYAVTVTNTGSNNIGTTKYKLHVYYGDIVRFGHVGNNRIRTTAPPRR